MDEPTHLPQRSSREGAPAAATPAEAGLRLISDSLGVPAAVLFGRGADGEFRVEAAVGPWASNAHALRGLAATLGGPFDVLDATDAVEGARFAAGALLESSGGVLLVLSPDDRTPDAAWSEAFAASVQVADGLVGGHERTRHARLVHEIAVHPGSFDVRLGHALQQLADVLGLDAAVFARVADGTWRAEARFDPTGQLVPSAVPLGATVCATTCRSDGPLAIADAADFPSAAALHSSAPAAYIGAPVFVDGTCVGTLSALGAQPRTSPFGEDDRTLVESLAHWIGSSLAGRDTARRLAEREAALTAFFDAAPMGMGVARLVRGAGGDDLQIVTVNASAASFFGAAPSALSGRMASTLRNGAPALSLWLSACRQAAEGTPRRFEMSTGGPEPRHFTATVARIAIDNDGGAPHFTFVVEDVTAQRRADDRLREREAQVEAILTEAPVALFATDAEGCVTMSRGRGAEALGLDATEGRALADLFASIPEAEVSVLRALEGVASSWTVSADERWFECRTVPTTDAAGAYSGLIGVAIDVTERERGARAVAHASRSLEAAAQARGAFLKHLNHELRSPLTSILGYADLLHEGAAPDEVAEVRDVIARSGGRLLAALDDLLDLTLLDSDDVVVSPVPTDVVAIVEAVTEANRTAADARRLSLNLLSLLPNEPLFLDAALFERVVRHLIGGAVASAASGRVDVRLHSAGADQIELRVAGGTGDVGIGPDLVHRLVAAMGGTSTHDAGDTAGWTVRLPRQPVPVVDLGDGAAGPHEATSVALVSAAG